ncbi:hypothetical protein JCM3765_000192 [Sporobolomyces pararoseus]
MPGIETGWADPEPEETTDAQATVTEADSVSSDAQKLVQAKRIRQAFPPTRPFVTICISTTREGCPNKESCTDVHFVRALRAHTDPSLGDCSYLNTCHRMETCRYVHWVLEDPGKLSEEEQTRRKAEEAEKAKRREASEKALPPQWVNADLRELDVSVLGKYDVVVADPPWAIHQELPYGTLTDAEMMEMPVGSMQDEGGLLFLWVTGRAMELGRECLAAWGYERIDELVWIKTNQLQGLIRTGRTGHWLNHSKEHCLVAVRRPDPSQPLRLPSWFNKGLDTQVLLAEVRQTSRKPDELYDMIERVLGGKARGRKVELFGRKHNLRDGWWTLGNQLGEKDQIFENDVVERFAQRYAIIFSLLPLGLLAESAFCIQRHPERGVTLSDPANLASTH